MAKHPLYSTWSSMIQRCTNPNRDNFHLYGGRGITVCLRWRTFAMFLYDMGEKPSPQHTLDRINPEGNYEPGNCRWATTKEQADTMRRKPTRYCTRCGSPTNGKTRRGLCHTCAEYLRRNGTHRPHSKGEIKATRIAKITAACAKPVLQLDSSGTIISRHDSAAAAARTLNANHPTSINNALHGRAHSAHGYRWTYA